MKEDTKRGKCLDVLGEKRIPARVALFYSFESARSPHYRLIRRRSISEKQQPFPPQYNADSRARVRQTWDGGQTVPDWSPATHPFEVEIQGWSGVDIQQYRCRCNLLRARVLRETESERAEKRSTCDIVLPLAFPCVLCSGLVLLIISCLYPVLPSGSLLQTKQKQLVRSFVCAIEDLFNNTCCLPRNSGSVQH